MVLWSAKGVDLLLGYCLANYWDIAERDKVRHLGIGDESRARALRANQGLDTRNYRAIVSQRGPEYAREWQREPMRARVGVTESHRESERDRERSSKSQREPVKA